MLCEKPLVHDSDLTDNECRHRADHLVEVAQSKGLLLGTQMQYVFAGPVIQELSGVDPDEISRFSMVMQTKNVMPGRTHRILWIDLAPHPISLLQSLIPGITLDASLAYEERELEAIAVFRMRRPDGRTIRVSVEIGCVPGREPRREVVLNDSRVEYAGFQDTDGVFKARIWNTGGETRVVPDFVNSLMGNFVRAHAGIEPLRVSGAMGAENLDWLLRLSDPDLI